VKNHCASTRLLAPGAVPPYTRGQAYELRRRHRQARPGPRLRHLQARPRVRLRLVLERDDLKPRHAPLPGHERSLPSPTCRRTARIRSSRGFPVAKSRREADRARRGGEEIRSVYKDYRRPSASTARARVEQLPLIWKDLIAAGFESGHAYGKALRTVKSASATPGAATACRIRLDGDRHREPLPRHPLAAQDEDGGFGRHARVRRGAGQGRGHHRHGKGLDLYVCATAA